VNLAVQDNIYKFQDVLKEYPKADVVNRHHFSDGMYAREMFMPANTCVVGAKHKTRHFYSVVKGECSVVSVHEREDIKAPFLGETLPGTKRIIYAHTDCIWITYHPTQLTNVEEIEKALVELEVI
tara:strand:+ start:40 stop:414 length:375 start_codon:yes stop_codon:yes gene_type:complete